MKNFVKLEQVQVSELTFVEGGFKKPIDEIYVPLYGIQLYGIFPLYGIRCDFELE